jgi:hypothetical protein
MITTILTISSGAQETSAPRDSEPAQNSTLWLQGHFREINSASPVVGSATMTVQLAQTIVNAIPAKHKKDFAESGFDVDTIAMDVQAAPLKEGLTYQHEEYILALQKENQLIESNATASYLVIKSNQLPMPLKVPLAITNLSVKLIQFAFEDFQGLDQPLRRVIEEIKKLPPMVILQGEDRLMGDWMEISLE